MAENGASVYQILKDILTENIMLLNSRDELIRLLDEKTPGSSQRELSSIIKALQYGAGEIFLQAYNANTSETRGNAVKRVRKILDDNNMQERTVQSVIDIFSYALGWIGKADIVAAELSSADVDELKAVNRDLNAKLEDSYAEINMLKQILSDTVKRLNSLEQAFVSLTDNRISSLERAFMKQADLFKKKTSNLENSIADIENAMKISKKRKQEISSDEFRFSNQEDDFVENFIEKYNELADSSTPYKIESFYRNYNVIAFGCSNWAKRISNLYQPPVFESTDKGSYWAVRVKFDIFAVVPKLNLHYEYMVHKGAGMQEVFVSNFKKEEFSHIAVKKAAFFKFENNKWHLLKQGQIELYN